MLRTEAGEGERVSVEAVRMLALPTATADGVPALPGVDAATAQQFAALYTSDFSRLAGYLTSLTGDADVAREAAQEAFTRLFARWRKVDEPRGFVYVVGTNLCRHHWRQNGRERAAVSSLGITSRSDDQAHDPWLRDLVERLPLRLREVVLLHYYADLPVVEVAAAVHRPVGTVKRRLHEARTLLAGAVEEAGRR